MVKAKTTFEMESDLDRRFRHTIGRIYGMKKGIIGEVLAEAIEDWIKKKESESPS